MTEAAATIGQAGRTGARGAGDGAAAEFERLYRANVEAVTAYFARRGADPHVVADLTADTFVTAITSFGSFDPGQGTVRAWVFGIARHVYAAHCEAYGQRSPDATSRRAEFCWPAAAPSPSALPSSASSWPRAPRAVPPLT